MGCRSSLEGCTPAVVSPLIGAGQSVLGGLPTPAARKPDIVAVARTFMRGSQALFLLWLCPLVGREKSVSSSLPCTVRRRPEHRANRTR